MHQSGTKKLNTQEVCNGNENYIKISWEDLELSYYPHPQGNLSNLKSQKQQMALRGGNSTDSTS